MASFANKLDKYGNLSPSEHEELTPSEHKDYHKEDEEIFMKYKDEIIKEYGSDALDTEQCNRIGKKYLKSRWGGCLPWDKVHLAPNKYYVVNTSSERAGGPGIHWMGLVITNKNAYLWDSYDRSVKRLLPQLIRSMRKHGFKLKETDHPMDQIGQTSQTCGHQSLAFLLTVRDVGIERAKHI